MSDLKGFGFRLIPIIPPTAKHSGAGKAPGEYSVGMWRGFSKWQRFRDQEPSAFETGLWANFPGANAGIVMGSPVGPDLHVIALDFDATDHDALSALLSAAPASPMVKRGEKGETRLYVAAKTVKTGSYDGPDGRLLDVLAGFDTRQTIVPPSIHPKTGKPYVWTRGPVPASQLPVLTEDDLAVLEETLEACGWVRGGTRAARPARTGSAGPIDVDDLWSETKTAALANLDAWVPALDLYGCRRARSGYEAVATFRPSSTGRPIPERKLNLSIQTNGILDFGTNETYSAIDLVMAAHDCDMEDATDWLRERLGFVADAPMLLDQPTRAAPAERQAFVPDTPPQPWSELPVETDQPPTMQRPLASIPTAKSEELPDHLTRVPGLVGLITDWIVDTAVSPQRGLALAAALTLVGTVAGRKFGGPTYSGTHLYILALAPTGAGKDHPLSMIGSILDACELPAYRGPSQFMSQTAVVNMLLRRPCCVCAMDEFGSFLQRVNGKRAGGHEQAITGILRSAWGASFSSFVSPAYAQSDGQLVIAPALSIFGVSTPEEFYAAVEGGDLFNGFLNRFLTISTRSVPKPREAPKDKFDVPSEIVDGLLGIYNAGGSLLGASLHNGRAGKPAIVVPWEGGSESQAWRVYDRLRDDIRDRTTDAALLVRTAEMAVRIATNLSIGVNHTNPAVTVEAMEWARDLAMWSAERMIVDAAGYMSESEHQTAVNRAWGIIAENKGRMSGTAFCKATGWVTSTRQREDILADLVNSGRVTAETDRSPGRKGRPPTWIEACH